MKTGEEQHVAQQVVGKKNARQAWYVATGDWWCYYVGAAKRITLSVPGASRIGYACLVRRVLHAGVSPFSAVPRGTAF